MSLSVAFGLAVVVLEQLDLAACQDVCRQHLNEVAGTFGVGVGPPNRAAEEQHVESEEEQGDVDAEHEAQLEVYLGEDGLHLLFEHVQHQGVPFVEASVEVLEDEANGLVGFEELGALRIERHCLERHRDKVGPRARLCERVKPLVTRAPVPLQHRFDRFLELEGEGVDPPRAGGWVVDVAVLGTAVCAVPIRVPRAPSVIHDFVMRGAPEVSPLCYVFRAATPHC
mmetsp:Transcript_65257/g.155846  ORF Transcript_65257/g.155846 Transcript_65257/m.155846 type:complete len:226 (+) Transcript_65257:111-788(+)